MRHVLYLVALLVAALTVIYGAAGILEQQALHKRDARIEQPPPPQTPVAARAAGMPASSKAPLRGVPAAQD
jgi:hypothetical protein